MNNLIPQNNVQNIINKFCVTIGIIPSSYKMALSYEEQILAIGKFLEDEIIPSLNNNAEAVQELQGLYIDLKNYVDNYFDNLDVQEEVNNKIEALKESGELEEIMTHYLEVKGVLGFDTISLMKQAENLIEGSIIRTLGNISYDDGKGEFYRVRQLTSSDVIDEINIIALNNFPTLIAELIPDDKIASILEDISTINENIDNIEENIDEIEETITNNETYKFVPSAVKGFAHRGLSCEAPENTIASVLKAGYHGCYGVEIDAQVTSDGEIILMHDDTVDRMTDGTGTVNNLTYAYIASLNIDNGNDLEYYPTQKVPLLSDVLNICNQFGLVPMIELKGTWNDTNLTKLLNTLKLYNMLKTATIISFTVSIIQALRNLNSYIKVGYIYGGELTDDIVNLCIATKNCNIGLAYDYNEIIPQNLRLKMIENNVKFGLWTVDDGVTVHSLITNNPRY